MASASIAMAQTNGGSEKDQREPVKKTLLELFELSKSGRYPESARFFVYRGTDEKRRDLDVYNFNDPEERRDIEEVAGEIKGMIWLSDSYEFSEYIEKVQGARRVYIWRLIFKGGASQATITFAFLKIKDRYAIFDIDGQSGYTRDLIKGMENL